MQIGDDRAKGGESSIFERVKRMREQIRIIRGQTAVLKSYTVSRNKDASDSSTNRCIIHAVIKLSAGRNN